MYSTLKTKVTRCSCIRVSGSRRHLLLRQSPLSVTTARKSLHQIHPFRTSYYHSVLFCINQHSSAGRAYHMSYCRSLDICPAILARLLYSGTFNCHSLPRCKLLSQAGCDGVGYSRPQCRLLRHLRSRDQQR